MFGEADLVQRNDLLNKGFPLKLCVKRYVRSVYDARSSANGQFKNNTNKIGFTARYQPYEHDFWWEGVGVY